MTDDTVLTVAVDAMGGDHAPAAVLDGAVQAARTLGVALALVGPAALLARELQRRDVSGLRLAVVDAPDVVPMDEAPLAALRRRPRASVRVAADLVASGEAAAFFSAGHSGATLLAAHAALGLMPGVQRPALAVTVPTQTGAAVLLDAGANLECRADHLVQFAHLGVAYASVAMDLASPRVGLLSIGEEARKGTDLVREAHGRLRSESLNFIGNIEARELFSGRADVVVCDGFTGNIALKVGEGLVEALEEMLRQELDAAIVSQIGGLLMRRAFARFRQRVDYAEYGAAPLLGVGGLALVGHGRSSSRAVGSGIAMAARLAESRMTDRLRTAFGAAG
ncbi:MAG: phosphate acyltransferase PlsX [Acidobacteria bacterium]|nr:phosphate acyltransferase PlsX [Acidobacteriota bacterium]